MWLPSLTGASAPVREGSHVMRPEEISRLFRRFLRRAASAYKKVLTYDAFSGHQS
jgi:hypothetical protein